MTTNLNIARGGGLFGLCKKEETIKALKKIINNHFDNYGYPKGSSKKDKVKIDEIAQPAIDKLEFKPNKDSDWETGGVAGYKKNGGSPSKIQRAVRIYSQSTNGESVLDNITGKLTIRAKGGGKIVPEAITGLNTIYMNGDVPLPELAFAHEIGHTKAGGVYIDHGHDKVWPTNKKINNVEKHENVFRKWVGGLEKKGKTYQRACYEESIPQNLRSGSNNVYNTDGTEMADNVLNKLMKTTHQPLKNPKKI